MSNKTADSVDIDTQDVNKTNKDSVISATPGAGQAFARDIDVPNKTDNEVQQALKQPMHQN